VRIGVSTWVKLVFLWVAFGLSGRLTAQNLVSSAPRADITLNGLWQYVLNQSQDAIPTSGWSTERVPALPLTDGTTSVWYQQTLFVPSSWVQLNRKFFVKLEQAGHYAAVYSNGTFIGDHFGQFSPFEVEVTNYILGGQNNQIQIYVHKADTTYIRAGVDIDQSSCPPSNPDCIGNAYRSATPTVTERNWVGLAGDVTFSWRPSTYISDVAVISSVRNWTLQANLQVSGSGTFTAQAAVLDGAQTVLTLPSQPVVSGAVTLEASWTTPVLWGPSPYGQPKLYTLQTTLLRGGKRVDVVYTQFGFREVWVSGTDVMLNGQKLWLVGNAVDQLSSIRYVNDRREEAFAFFTAESAGANTVESHWDEPGEPWLQLADEMGMLVVGSFFCDGRPQIQSQVDSVTDWSQWMTFTAQEWVQAVKNHPSIVIWRPLDVFPQGVPLSAVSPSLEAAIQAADPSGRPIADGSDIDIWGQSIQSTTNPQQCDNGEAYASKLAADTLPLLVKEIFGNYNLSCAPTFWNTFYGDAFTGGGVGLVITDLIPEDESVTPTWFSISGIGNRPTSSQDIPDWITQTWTPTAVGTQFAGLYQTYWQPTLPSTSPSSGDYQASGLSAAAPETIAFLMPTGVTGSPVGVLIAQDGSGTAWFVVPQPGAYNLLYSTGSADVITPVTVSAPPPF